uniref:Uncharacterized protein n=2 Tax=Salix viminalis TaxID=40686 RepID=A0A6N2KXP7_SALVM
MIMSLPQRERERGVFLKVEPGAEKLTSKNSIGFTNKVCLPGRMGRGQVMSERYCVFSVFHDGSRLAFYPFSVVIYNSPNLAD